MADILDNTGRFGPLARAFADAGPAAIDKAKVAIAAALEPHLGPNGISLPGTCWLVSTGRG
jgi:hypothetical protein